jgi:hypothetical protein
MTKPLPPTISGRFTDPKIRSISAGTAIGRKEKPQVETQGDYFNTIICISEFTSRIQIKSVNLLKAPITTHNKNI